MVLQLSLKNLIVHRSTITPGEERRAVDCPFWVDVCSADEQDHDAGQTGASDEAGRQGDTTFVGGEHAVQQPAFLLAAGVAAEPEDEGAEADRRADEELDHEAQRQADGRDREGLLVGSLPVVVQPLEPDCHRDARQRAPAGRDRNRGQPLVKNLRQSLPDDGARQRHLVTSKLADVAIEDAVKGHRAGRRAGDGADDVGDRLLPRLGTEQPARPDVHQQVGGVAAHLSGDASGGQVDPRHARGEGRRVELRQLGQSAAGGVGGLRRRVDGDQAEDADHDDGTDPHQDVDPEEGVPHQHHHQAGDGDADVEDRHRQLDALEHILTLRLRARALEGTPNHGGIGDEGVERRRRDHGHARPQGPAHDGAVTETLAVENAGVDQHGDDDQEVDRATQQPGQAGPRPHDATDADQGRVRGHVDRPLLQEPRQEVERGFREESPAAGGGERPDSGEESTTSQDLGLDLVGRVVAV